MKWKLPKVFKPSKVKKGKRQRHDGEPRFLDLIRHRNDRTLTTNEVVSCCDCGLTHHHTFNVLTIGRKWFLIIRAYRL